MDERLLQLIGLAQPRIGYVASAPDPNRFDFENRRAHYADLGADLALCVDSDTVNASTVDALFDCDAIHLSGGNTFSFSRWLQKSGLLARLRAHARRGGVLVGVSAGAILMTEHIGTASLCGDVASHPVDEHESLGLLQFGFWPHHVAGAAHRLPTAIGATFRGPICACPDGAGLVVDGSDVEVFGPVSVMGGEPPGASAVDQIKSLLAGDADARQSQAHGADKAARR